MIPLKTVGIETAEQRRWLRETLATSHSMRARVYLQNLEGDTLNELSDRLMDGQVDVDADAEVSRACTIQLLDPNRTLAFASDSPTEAAIYLDRMIHVTYGVFIPEMNQWIDIPVFTGPITKLDREQDVVNVEAHGKEALALGSIHKVFERKKGANVVDTIHDLLTVRCGEASTNMKLPEMPNARLRNNVGIRGEQKPWLTAKELSESVDRQLFYDGDGMCRMRRYPDKAIFTFKDGTDGTITSLPQVSYTTDELINIVKVVGGPPGSAKPDSESTDETKKKVEVKQNKPPVVAIAEAPDEHPVSPARLGRNGTKFYLLEVIRNSKIVKQSAAERIARRRLRKHLLAHVEVSFEAMPIPFLEEYDVLAVDTDNYSGEFVLKSFSIPLTVGENMSFGFNKRMKFRTQKKRARKGGRNKR